MNSQTIDTSAAASQAIIESVSNPSRVAIRAAFNSLGALGLEAQTKAVQQIIEIGGVKTHWSRPINEALPPFKHIWTQDMQLLLVWRQSELTVFGRRSSSSPYEKIKTATQHARVFDALPPYMFKPAVIVQRASPKQMQTLRHLLRLEPALPMHDLCVSAAAALINGFVVEPALVRILAQAAPQIPNVEATS